MSNDRLLTDEELCPNIAETEALAKQDIKTASIVRAEILNRLERHNKYPQCKGLVLTVEDWEALKQGRIPEE